MPSDSYLREWIRVYDADYPDNGWDAEVYSGDLSYLDLPNINKLVTELEQLKDDKMYLRGMKISLLLFNNVYVFRCR